ncbi:MAG: HEAT repeat domain-containing protein, partial [Candidatus Heimdallarchaeota archaeon]|nr:HEAT repeat domain-containing protein [Candidatus Heimdallarchaeota archaeon]
IATLTVKEQLGKEEEKDSSLPLDLEEKEEEQHIEVGKEVFENQTVITKIVKEDLDLLISTLINSNRNKVRLDIIEKIGEFIEEEKVKNTLSNISKNDKHPLCRAKAVSYLSDIIEDKQVKETILSKLNDSAKVVRHWAVWGLKGVISESDVQKALIKRLLREEKSRKIKLWIIKILSSQIKTDRVEEAFLGLLKQNLNIETKGLVVDYLLNNLSDREICYQLSTYVLKERNKEIKTKIIKKFLTIDNLDVKYSLERLEREEYDENILSLLKNR